MFSNSLVAGAMTSSYVLVLLVLLNPTLPLEPLALLPIVLRVGAFYAASGAVVAFTLLLLRVVFGRRLFAPAWLSVTVLAWLGAAASAAGAVLMWVNIRTFALVLDARTIAIVAQSAVILAAVSGILLITAMLQRYRLRRGWWAVWVVSTSLASVALPLVLRAQSPLAPLAARPLGDLLDVPAPDRLAKVTVVALDAGSLEFISSAASEGRLPNFGRILDAGAVTHLATLHPTSADAVWAAIATGKLPQKNGIRSAAVYRVAGDGSGPPIQLLPDFCFATALLRFGILAEEPLTSASLRSRTLWAILSAAGVSVGVVNFPLTDPVPAVRGFIVSNTYVRQSQRSSTPADPAGVYPDDLRVETSAVLREAEVSAAPDVPGAVTERQRAPARLDRIYDRLHRYLTLMHPVQVSLMRFQSLDAIGHYFLRYAMPSQFGDVTEEDRRRYGGLLEAHYALVDEAIGRAIDGLGSDDLLLVVSAYGMEPLSMGKRVIELLIGDPEVSGTHEAAPDGFLMAYGASVARARQLRRASVVDVLPTILYFLGLPVARDLDGFARADLFLPAFTKEHPITFIPSYDR